MKTGEGVKMEEVSGIVQIDIDIDKTLEDEKRFWKYSDLRSSITLKYSHGVTIVKTVSNSLHIWCAYDTENNPLGLASNHEIITGDGYEIEILSGINPDKHQLATLPGGKAKNKMGEIGTYEIVYGGWDEPITVTLEDVLECLKHEYTPKVKTPKIAVEHDDADDECFSVEVQKLLVEGIENFQVHNTTHRNTGVDKEVSLMPLFKTLNSLDDSLKNKAYMKAYKLTTDEAEKHWDEVKEKFADERESLRTLAFIVKTYNSKYYNKTVAPVMRDEYFAKLEKEKQEALENNTSGIDLKDTEFQYSSIQEKCLSGAYKSTTELALDMVRVFCCIENSLEFAMKSLDKKIPHLCSMKMINDTTFERMAKFLIISIPNPENERKPLKLTGWDAYLEHQTLFNVKQDAEIFNWFIGYYYDPTRVPLEEAEQHPGVIKTLKHMKEVCFDGDVSAYNYWLNSEKLKYRTHGRKGHFFILQGNKYGTGKTFIFDILDLLYKRYCKTYPSLKDAIDPKHSAQLDGLLYVFIEEMPSYSDKSWDNNVLKGVINGKRVIEGRTLFKDFRSLDFTFDFAGTSNMDNPYYVDDKNERRLFISAVNEEHMQDQVYFNDLFAEIQPGGPNSPFLDDFLYAFSSYLYNSPIDEDVNLSKIPLTKKKLEMAETHEKENKYVDFINEYYKPLKKGITSACLSEYINDFIKRWGYSIKPISFLKEFNKYIPVHLSTAEEMRNLGLTKKTRLYTLTPELEAKYCCADEEELEEVNEIIDEKYRTIIEEKDEEIKKLKAKIELLKKRLGEC